MFVLVVGAGSSSPSRGYGARQRPQLRPERSWPERQVWTYTLKPGLKFEDGTPIRSEDIK